MVGMSKSSDGGEPEPEAIEIREVWKWNAEREFERIRRLVRRFPFVSMDTEFPGVVYKSSVPPSSPQQRYAILKANVDALSLIQVGLTLADACGNMPADPASGRPMIWQINFCDFDPSRDPCAADSIALLRRQGIDFDRNKAHGVPSASLRRLLRASGLLGGGGVVPVSWVTFHSAYDFAYLVKAITGGGPLPESLAEFDELRARLFGPRVYDLKHLVRFCKSGHSLLGGLERLAAGLRVRRAAGKAHQAASDSLLTWHAFLRVRQLYFHHGAAEKHAGVLYGLEHHQQPYALAY